MRILRPGVERGRSATDWLDSRHAFSFGQFHDPRWMGFGALRVLNDDTVAAGAGFATHGHANMEILSYVLSGALAHQDDAGGGGVVRPGELQWMSAGHGVRHSEFNASDAEAVHFLQVWIQPDRVNAAPAYAQRAFALADRRARWAVLASPDGADGSLAIRQQATVQGVHLAAGESVERLLASDRRYWLHIAQGSAIVDDRPMVAGDALGIADEDAALRVAGAGPGLADILLFDLPA